MSISRMTLAVSAGAALVGAMLGPIHAQSAKVSPELIAAAEKEGKVVWYSTLLVNELINPVTEAWAKTYPNIKLSFARASSADQIIKITNEAAAGKLQADVFDGTTTMFPLIKAGMVGSYNPVSAQHYPSVYRDAGGLWTATNVFVSVPAYNTESVSESDAPKTLDDLLDPRFKGRMAWSNNAGPATAPGFVGSVLIRKGEEAGMEYLRQLSSQNIANISGTPRVVLDQVIGFSYDVGLMTYSHHSIASAADGASVKWIKFDPTVVVPSYVNLLKDAPHPNAAKLFIEFLLSDEGQSIFREAGYVTASPSAPPSDASQLPSEGDPAAVFMTPDLVQANLDRWTSIQKELFP